MRKLLLVLAVTAATAAVPASAGASTDWPHLCDYVQNTMCDAPDRLLPPPPEVPSSCEYLANTACHYLPPRSLEDVCGLIEATHLASCTISRR